MHTLTWDYPTPIALPEAGAAERLRALLTLWYQRARQRRQLRQLADWQLDDIGISRGDAEREGRKPFWRG